MCYIYNQNHSINPQKKVMRMKTSYVFMADGFEEVEALTVVDVLRRAGMPVVTVSINATSEVTGAHGVKMLADTVIAGCDLADA